MNIRTAIEDTPELDSFRGEVRDWIAKNLLEATEIIMKQVG